MPARIAAPVISCVRGVGLSFVSGVTPMDRISLLGLSRPLTWPE